MSTKNTTAIESTNTGSELVELGEAELESASGGLAYYAGDFGSCMGASAGMLGGWGAFEYCLASGLGLI